MKLSLVLKSVLKEHSFSSSELKEIEKEAFSIIKTLKKLGLKVFIGGSLAKGTIIRKEIQDIDIFAVFDDEINLEEKIEKSGLNAEKIHGSRDYFHIRKGNVIFEIIPVKKISDMRNVENVTDFSLLHVDYVGKKIAKNKKLADEIKLAKLFCYSQNCYGAESYIQGFSGYALELLVIYFGGFVKFLKGIEKKKVIDIEKQFKNEKMIHLELNESKLLSPVVLIDSVYKYRNVCAGLSLETFALFLKSAKAFIKNPSINYFEKNEIDLNKLEKDAKKKKAKLLSLKFETSKQEGDIAATKMKKFFNFIIRELERKEQKVIFSDFVYKSPEANGHIILKEKKEIEIKGPPLKNKEALKRFKESKRIYEKNGFAYAKIRISAEDILKFAKRFEDEMNVRFSY